MRAPRVTTGRRLLLALAALAAATTAAAIGEGPDAFFPARYWPDSPTPDGAETIPLEAGEIRDDLLLVLVDGGGSIEGLVRTPTGDPLDGILVMAERGPFRSHGLTGATGRFTINGLAPGENILRALTYDPRSAHPDLMPLYFPSVVDSAAATAVTVTAGETTFAGQIVLEPGATIDGRIVASEGETPLPGLDIETVRIESGDVFHTETDAKGEFLLQGLPPGNYLFRVRPGDARYLEEFYDGVRDSADATLITLESPASSHNVQMSLEREGRIFGRVQNRDSGEGIKGVEVLAIETVSRFQSKTVTDGGGFFIIRALRPGTYIVFVPAIGTYFIDATNEADARLIPVAEGEDVPSINMEGTLTDQCGGVPENLGSVSGQIIVDLPTPPAGWTVRAVSDGYEREQTFVDAGGYTLQCLLGGDYVVSIRTDSTYARLYYMDAIIEADATPVSVAKEDTTKEIDFTPPLAARIGGVVVGPDMTPLTGAPVRIHFEDGGIEATGETNEEGRFLIGALPDGTGLPAGSYKVSVDSFTTGARLPTPVRVLPASAELVLLGGSPSVAVSANLPFGAGPFTMELHRKQVGAEPQLIERRFREGTSGGVVTMADGDPPAGRPAYRISAVAGADSLVSPWLPVDVPAAHDRIFSRGAGPNPAAAGWKLSLEIDRPVRVALEIYSVDGRRVRRLVADFSPGTRALEWDGRDDAGRPACGGVYTYLLRDARWGTRLLSGRLTLIR